MRKFYVLLLMAFGAAGMCMAQDTAGGDTVEGETIEGLTPKEVTINNWDGSYKSPNMPLYIGVEEIKILSLTLDPGNADIETLHIIIEAEEWNEGEETGKEEGYDDTDRPIEVWGREIFALRPAVGVLQVWTEDSTLMASTEIIAYATSGEMDADSTTTWSIETNEDTGEVQLVITKDPSSSEPGILPDRTDETYYPWDEMGYTITNLNIDGNYSYIGEGVFDRLYNVQNIQFSGQDQNIASIHYMAFSEEIHPWRFAFGNPQDGPLVPPQVIFDQGMSEQNGLEVWQHMFSEETVLYVPDAIVNYQGREVRAVDLYRNHEVWGNTFARIDDHTVEVAEVSETSVLLKWMPQAGAVSYLLRIHKLGCDECDTTIVIEADGYRGLIYAEDQMPMPMLRAPKSDDGGGGMTLTILIGGGGRQTENVTAQVSGMESSADYDFIRDVYTEEGLVADLSKGGVVETLPDAAEGIEDLWVSGEKRAYDLLGRPMGSSLEDLPAGMYIWDDGTKRTTIMINK